MNRTVKFVTGMALATLPLLISLVVFEEYKKWQMRRMVKSASTTEG
jgi:hypothetical protein